MLHFILKYLIFYTCFFFLRNWPFPLFKNKLSMEGICRMESTKPHLKMLLFDFFFKQNNDVLVFSSLSHPWLPLCSLLHWLVWFARNLLIREKRYVTVSVWSFPPLPQALCMPLMIHPLQWRIIEVLPRSSNPYMHMRLLRRCWQLRASWSAHAFILKPSSLSLILNPISCVFPPPLLPWKPAGTLWMGCLYFFHHDEEDDSLVSVVKVKFTSRLGSLRTKFKTVLLIINGCSFNVDLFLFYFFWHLLHSHFLEF